MSLTIIGNMPLLLPAPQDGTGAPNLYEVSETDNGLGVRIPVYEGPFDLLLHLVHRERIEIREIEISRITHQYMHTLSVMKSLNIQLAAEFMVIAATLMEIKSRRLLPKDPDPSQSVENLGNDPERELIERLVSYKQFREAAIQIAQKPLLGRDTFKPAIVDNVGGKTRQKVAISVFELVDAWMAVVKDRPTIQYKVQPIQFTVKQGIQRVRRILSESGAIVFDDLFLGGEAFVVMVSTFLALLEMMRRQMVRLRHHNSTYLILPTPKLL